MSGYIHFGPPQTNIVILAIDYFLADTFSHKRHTIFYHIIIEYFVNTGTQVIGYGILQGKIIYTSCQRDEQIFIFSFYLNTATNLSTVPVKRVENFSHSRHTIFSSYYNYFLDVRKFSGDEENVCSCQYLVSYMLIHYRFFITTPKLLT